MPTRRHVIASGLIGIVGFSSVMATALQSESDPEPQPTPTTRATATPTADQTPSPTKSSIPSPTPTPPGVPKPPQVVLINLLSEWNSMGDVKENAIGSIEQGSTAVIGALHETGAHGGHQRATVMVRIDGHRRTTLVEREVSADGPVLWETTIEFDTEGWTTGTKSVTVVIRDEISGFVSEPESRQFELT